MEPLDDQSRAFREAGQEDNVWDPSLTSRSQGAALHPGADSGIYSYTPPEKYEEENWDAGREGPKNIEEARSALAARIQDPHAPDGPEVEGAYDGISEEDS